MKRIETMQFRMKSIRVEATEVERGGILNSIKVIQ
jgi:hypothetical protein